MLSWKPSKENISVNRAKEADRSGEPSARINHRVLYGRQDRGPGQVAGWVGSRNKRLTTFGSVWESRWGLGHSSSRSFAATGVVKWGRSWRRAEFQEDLFLFFKGRR